MSRSTLITAIGEASYIDDQSKYSQKFNSQLSKRLSHKGAFPDFLPEHTSAVSRRQAVLTIRASVGAASKVRAYYYKGTVEALESIS